MPMSRLDKIKKALANAPAPSAEEMELTARRVVKEAFEEIRAMREAGHKFETIAEIIASAGDEGVEVASSTLKSYYTDERKERRKAANRAKREANRLERESATPQQPQPQVINATLEDDDEEPQ